MAENTGLNKPVRLKSDLAAFCGTQELSRAAVTQKLWDYIKAQKLQAKTENGAAEGNGKFIVADETLLKLFKATNVTNKAGKVTNFSNMQAGNTISMLQLASVVGANIE
jgi:chromatin remodeling complex protein RSC6